MAVQANEREMQFRSVKEEVTDALLQEAELLDDNRVREWFDAFVHEDIDYEVPVRVTRERSGGPGFAEGSWHMKETWGTLATRVARLDSEYAWAEDPPSRTRRFVTNIRVEPGGSDDEVTVRSNLLIYRGRYDTTDHQLLSGERRDRFRRTDGSWKLVKRLVLLDHTTLPTHNLAIFF